MLGSDVQRDISLLPAKKCGHTLRVETEEGTLKFLHSIYDPEAEAKRVVDAFVYSGKGMLVVLGLGLGYHVAELLRKYPEAELIVVESEETIFSLAGEYGPELKGNIEFIAGCVLGQVIREISRKQMKGGIKPLAIFTLPSALSAFPGYYNPLISELNKIIGVRLWDRLQYEKFKKDSLHVLIIDTGYFLLKEVEMSLKHLGHMVRKVPVTRDIRGERVLSGFIEAILDLKPDFIMTINHLGFDEEGILTDFFRSIKIPVASWFVDSPTLIVRDFNKNVSPYSSLFMWDKSYVNEMESMGFESVKYLPMGTAESVFKPLTASKHRKKIAHYSCDVGFVGNSLFNMTAEKMDKVAYTFRPFIDKAAHKLCQRGSSVLEVMKKMDTDELKEYEALIDEQRLDVEAAILWKATLLYRLSCINNLTKFNVRIHGDQGWSELLDRSYKINPPLNYYKELPLFYNACKINFNATHLQMNEAVNQRVFDVPACGAFLLTDNQRALHDLFDPGKEIMVYRHRDEIPEITRFYLKYPWERERIALKARDRVLKEHTYQHRLRDLIQSMRKRYS